jgi:hypothetical protein
MRLSNIGSFLCLFWGIYVFYVDREERLGYCDSPFSCLFARSCLPVFACPTHIRIFVSTTTHYCSVNNSFLYISRAQITNVFSCDRFREQSISFSSIVGQRFQFYFLFSFRKPKRTYSTFGGRTLHPKSTRYAGQNPSRRNRNSSSLFRDDIIASTCARCIRIYHIYHTLRVRKSEQPSLFSAPRCSVRSAKQSTLDWPPDASSPPPAMS